MGKLNYLTFIVYILVMCPQIWAMTCEEAVGPQPELENQGSLAVDLGAKRPPAGRRLIDTTKRAPILHEIEVLLRKNVIAQPELLDSLMRVLERTLIVTNKRGPSGSLLITGPTGVGKNLLFETLAEAIGATLIELEGSNYMEKHQVTDLTGAGPTYAGHGTTEPKITQLKINNAQGEKLPLTIIMLNELDKAHPNFYDWWLKALDTGRNTVWVPNGGNSTTEEASETNNKGASEEEIDFSRTLIIGTANSGAENVNDQAKLIENYAQLNNSDEAQSAFGVGDLVHLLPPKEGFYSDIGRAIKETFKRPEFLGRWDEISIAWPLLDKGYMKVFENEIRKVRLELEASDSIEALPIKLTQRAQLWLLSQVDRKLGARNVTKVIKKFVTSEVTRAIGSGEIKSGDFVTGDLMSDGSGIEFYARTWETIKAKPLTTNKSRVSDGNLTDPEDKLKKLQSNRLKLITSDELKHGARLDHAQKYIHRADTISYEDAIYILSNIPRGVGWGQKKPKSTFYSKLMVENGLQSWAIRDFENIDYDIVFKTLSKITATISSDQAVKLKSSAKRVLKESLNSVNAKEDYMAEIYALVSIIIDDAILEPM